MTRLELQQALKDFREQGITLQVKLNAKNEVLQAEYNRILDTFPTADELETEDDTELETVVETVIYKNYKLEYMSSGDYDVYDSYDYLDTFSSLEKAQQYIDEILAEEKDETESVTIQEYRGCEIARYGESSVHYAVLDKITPCDSLELAKQAIDEFIDSGRDDYELIGQYCDILESEVYNGRACDIDPNLRINYVTSEFNFPSGDVNNYWREWNHAYQYALLMMRQSIKNYKSEIMLTRNSVSGYLGTES